MGWGKRSWNKKTCCFGLYMDFHFSIWCTKFECWQDNTLLHLMFWVSYHIISLPRHLCYSPWRWWWEQICGPVIDGKVYFKFLLCILYMHSIETWVHINILVCSLVLIFYSSPQWFNSNNLKQTILLIYSFLFDFRQKPFTINCDADNIA